MKPQQSSPEEAPNQTPQSSSKLWAGRSEEPTDKILDIFNSSFSFDYRLWREDIQGSQAHAKMLAKVGVISQEDSEKILEGLNQIAKEIEADELAWREKNLAEEDIHMAIEKQLTALIGEPARRLHTGRSRNDQVATDIRLWLRKENLVTRELILTLLETLLKLAERDASQILPGYTHLQRAQPISLGHHWMAHYERFYRDLQRFTEISLRVNINPLGSGALAGTTYPLDRDLTTKLLGFHSATKNSLDAVSDRDFVAEHQFASSLLMVHLSQLSEELILWSSDEFSFIQLDDKFATGSSMMPQKKNPDVPELIRGKSGRVIGNLQAILVTLKGLPLAYNKDLQEDKEGLFDTCTNLKICLRIMSSFLESIKINSSKMTEAAVKSFINATDAADYLVKKKVSFREAYKAVGQAVRFCIEENKLLQDLELADWKKFNKNFENDIQDFIKTENCLENRQTFGGTSPTKVRGAIPEAWVSIKQFHKTLNIERKPET